MPAKKEATPIVTKTGVTVTTCYCRKCMQLLPHTDFYDAVDNGMIDSNGKFSVCKPCIQKLYTDLFAEYQSLEKVLHKICILLNVKYSNEAASAVKTQLQTYFDSGRTVNAIYGIYRSKITATNASMQKNIIQDDGYEDVGTIFTEKQIDTTKVPIPQTVVDFWGADVRREDILFLEAQYTNFKAHHPSETYAEVVLLKEICFTMLNIKTLRANGDDTIKQVKELQELMKSLVISPNVVTAVGVVGKGEESIGTWIKDIERFEPSQWLKTSPMGDIYRDVPNTEEYFQKYFVRPLKNLITSSKDFNIDDNQEDDDMVTTDENINYAQLEDNEGE